MSDRQEVLPLAPDADLAQRLSRVELELKENQERYRAFLDQSSEAIWRMELDMPIPADLPVETQIQLLYERGYVAECNEAMARMHGFASAEEALGSRLGQLLPRISHQNIEFLRTFVRSGYRVTDVESSEMDRQGNVRYFSNNLIGILDAERGRLVRMWGVKRDVTERRKAEEALRRALGELGTLQAIASDVASMLEIGPLLSAIADRLQEILEYSTLVIFRLEGYVLTVAEYRGTVPREQALQQVVPLTELLEWSGLHEVIGERRPVIIPDVQANTQVAREWRRSLHPVQRLLLGNARSWLAVPLRAKEGVIGVLRLGHEQPNRFGPEEGRLALAFANHAAVAIENARLYEQGRSLAAMEERQRLARDLHDAVSQTLFSASLIADVLPKLYDRSQEQGRELLTDLRDLSRGALAEMRALLVELRPQALQEVRLDVLLRQLAEAATGRSRIPIEIVAEGMCRLPPDVQVALYRIAQEGLHNVAKHSGASRAWAIVRCTPGPDGVAVRAELEIADNGKGFDLENVSADRFGLSIMAERAADIGASLAIETAPGDGTRVIAVWPGDTPPPVF